MINKTRILWGLMVLLTAPLALPAAPATDAQKAELKALSDRLKYQDGQINLGDGLATLNLPGAYRYLDSAGTDTLLTGLWGNPASGRKTLGTIVPAGFDPFQSNAWCIVLSFEEDGYVKDDDASKLNYTKLLKQMQEGTRAASAERVKEGYPPIELVGWAAPPRYDKDTHKFYWAKEIKFGDVPGANTLNYNLRLLGRRGVLMLNVVADMSQFPQIDQATPEILGMIDFNAGHRYADYTPGVDKLATYGLAGLVAGGIALKMGLFKGLFVALLALKKFVIIGIIALIAILKKFLGTRRSPPAS